MPVDAVFQVALANVHVVEQDTFGRERLNDRGIVWAARPAFAANHGFAFFGRGANPLKGLRCGFVHQLHLSGPFLPPFLHAALYQKNGP